MLKIAGVFQDIKDVWAKRLDAYYSQLESLVQGQWLTSNELAGIVHESRMAAREAFDGFAGDLTAQLVHESKGLIARHENERATLAREITSLRESISRVTSVDENTVRRQNEALVIALMRVPEFRLLEIIRAHRQATYDELAEAANQKKSIIQKLCKVLLDGGYVAIDKKPKPHVVKYFSAPWEEVEVESAQYPSPEEDKSQITSSPTMGG